MHFHMENAVQLECRFLPSRKSHMIERVGYVFAGVLSHTCRMDHSAMLPRIAVKRKKHDEIILFQQRISGGKNIAF
jgi:hypothetical protein